MVSATYLLLEVLGAAALLLWGIRMARTAVMRAHGPQIRRLLPAVLEKRLTAFVAGTGAAAVLQSSTAVAIFIASLASMGVVPVTGGLALMLGADLGSAIVATLLTLNVKGLWPVLMLAGYVIHEIFSKSNSKAKQHGRFAVGLGLIMIALTFMGGFAGQIAARDSLRVLVASLADEPVLMVLALAILTWLSHSSLAILLFLASLSQEGVVADPSLIVPAILGVNLGAGIPALVMTWGQAPAARRIIIGNALFRFCAVVVCLALLSPLLRVYALLPGQDGFRVMEFHLLFNLVLAVLFIGFLDRIAAWLDRVVPQPAPAAGEIFGPRYIPPIPGAFQAALPLSALTREILRMSDVVHSMLDQTRNILSATDYDKERVIGIKRLDDRVDTLYAAIRGYAVDLTKSDLPEEELRRANALLRYSLALENVGDIVDKSLLDIMAQKAKARHVFSDDGVGELRRLFAFVLDSLEMAAEVIMGWRADLAGVLGARRDEFKRLVKESSELHIERLRQGVSGSLETSSYHLDAVNDLQRINSLIAGIADEVRAVGGETAKTGTETAVVEETL